jgi:hypothetical protein
MNRRSADIDDVEASKVATRSDPAKMYSVVVPRPALVVASEYRGLG